MPKTFPCEICGKVLTRSTVLRDHMRGVHWGEKPHVCKHTGCGTSFTRRPDLLQHQKLHKGGRVYICEVLNREGEQYGCGAAFNRKRDLARHRNRKLDLFCRLPQSRHKDATELTTHPERSSGASVHGHSVQSLVQQNATEKVILGLGDALEQVSAAIFTSGPKLLLQETDTAQQPEERTAQVETKPSWDVITRVVETARGTSACDDIGNPSYGPCIWYYEIWKSPPRREICSEYLRTRCLEPGHIYGLASDSDVKYFISSLWRQIRAFGTPHWRTVLGPGSQIPESSIYFHACSHHWFRLQQLALPDTTSEDMETSPVTPIQRSDISAGLTFDRASIDTIIDAVIFAQIKSPTEIYRGLGARLFAVMQLQQSEILDATFEYYGHGCWALLSHRCPTRPHMDSAHSLADLEAEGPTTELNMGLVSVRLQYLTRGFLQAWSKV